MKALRHNQKPEETRAYLIDYVAQELMLSRAIGLTPSDLATAASRTANLLPIKLDLNDEGDIKSESKNESPIPAEVKIESIQAVEKEDEVLAKPLVDCDPPQESLTLSDDTLITTTESTTSVSSQTDPCELDDITDTNLQPHVSDINDGEVVVKQKKEESCQTDAIPLENYVLDISELEKEKATTTVTPSVPAAPVEPTPVPVKPRTPSRLIVTRPSMAAAVVRGVARPTVARGRGIPSEVRPSTVQPRAVRSLTEIRGGLSAGRGLARKSLEPRLRAATTGSTLATRQVGYIYSKHDFS